MVDHPLTARLDKATVKRRGKVLLGPVSLELEPEGFTMVLGPNGAGKTTLLKLLHGVERLSTGDMSWSVPAEIARQAQAYVFQTPVMLRRTVRENLAYPLHLLGVPKGARAERVAAWAERIGLTPALDQSALRLSGGEKQKLAVGRALIRDPKVLFLDEPCANLDGRATRDIETLLLDALQAGTRIIMTTHDMGQARRLASDIVFLLNGLVQERGPAADFFDAPETAEAAAFLQGDILL